MAALTSPLDLATFFSNIAHVDWTLDFDDVSTAVETRGGKPIKISNGDPLWFGTFTVKPLLHQYVDTVLAKIRLLKRPDMRFMIRTPYRLGTIADPSGASWVGFTPNVTSVEANKREINLNGLPANAVISEGDYVSYNFNSPVQRGFHQVVTGKVANGSGVATLVEVNPPIHEGFTSGTVAFRQAYMLAVIVNENTSPARFRSVVADGISVAWRQYL